MSNVRKSKAVDHFMQDDTYEPVRPSINGQVPNRQDYDGPVTRILTLPPQIRLGSQVHVSEDLRYTPPRVLNPEQ